MRVAGRMPCARAGGYLPRRCDPLRKVIGSAQKLSAQNAPLVHGANGARSRLRDGLRTLRPPSARYFLRSSRRPKCTRLAGEIIRRGRRAMSLCRIAAASSVDRAARLAQHGDRGEFGRRRGIEVLKPTGAHAERHLPRRSFSGGIREYLTKAPSQTIHHARPRETDPLRGIGEAGDNGPEKGARRTPRLRQHARERRMKWDRLLVGSANARDRARYFKPYPCCRQPLRDRRILRARRTRLHSEGCRHVDIGLYAVGVNGH